MNIDSRLWHPRHKFSTARVAGARFAGRERRTDVLVADCWQGRQGKVCPFHGPLVSKFRSKNSLNGSSLPLFEIGPIFTNE